MAWLWMGNVAVQIGLSQYAVQLQAVDYKESVPDSLRKNLYC